jgi:hypothetical protein
MEEHNVQQAKRVNLQQIELEVPAKKIKNINAEVRDITYDIITDKIIIQGVIHKQIFYVGVDDVVYHQAEEMPFSTFIDVQGAEPGMEAQIHPQIEHIGFELSPDGGQLNQKVILEIFVKITETVQVNITEADGGALYNLEAVIGENNKQKMIESTFELEIPAIKITDITAEITEMQAEIITDKIVIQGVLHKQIFFVGEDNVGYHQAEDVPFSLFIDLPGATPGMNAQVHPNIELIKKELTSPTEIQQEVVIDFFVKVTETQELNVALGDGPLMKLDRVIGENTIQTMKTSDLTLDRQAIKIKDIDVTLRDLQTTVINNKVIVQGTIHKQIYYIGLDDVEFHQAEDVQFSNFIDIPGLEAGMDATVSGVVEHIKAELTDPTNLHQKVVVELIVKVTEEQQVNILIGNGPLIKAPQVINEGIEQIIVEQIAVIPAIPPPLPIEITRALIKEEITQQVSEQTLIGNVVALEVQAQKVRTVTGTVRDVTVEILDGSALVEGEVVKQVEYVDLDDVVRHMIEVVPFEILMELPDLDPDLVLSANVIIEDISFSLINDGLEMRQIIVLEATVEAGESRQVEVVTDVSGPDINIETLEARVQRVVGEEVITPTLDDTVSLSPAAQNIIEITGNFEDITTEVMTGQVMVSGNFVKEVEYLGIDDQVYRLFEEIPFEYTIEIEDIEPGMNVQVHPQVIDIGYQLSEDGTELSQTVEIEIFVKATETAIITVVTDISGPSIEEVIKEVVLLDVIGDGNPDPVPVEVVVDVIAD